MKKFFQLIIVLITYGSFAQKTDLVNAPENPIAIKYKLEHFNLKGDVFSYDSKYYFNKEGLLVSKSDYQGVTTYKYENGKLADDSASNSIKTNDQGYVIFIKKRYFIEDFTYNFSGLITSSSETKLDGSGKTIEMKIKAYSYDSENRVIKLEEYIKDGLKTITNYSYKKEGNIVKVFKEEITDGKSVASERRYKEGQLIYAKSNSDTIELKIEKKLDEKGNSVQDAYVNNGTETDVFDYTIVYYSDANKPINYTMVIFKGNNGKLYQHVHRNGVYFYTDLKTRLQASIDMLLYDDLTQTYYLAKNAYDTTLTEGTVIKFEPVVSNSEVLLKNMPESKVLIYYKGENILLASTVNKATFRFNNLFSYHVDSKTSKKKSFFFKEALGKTFASGELLPENEEHLYYYIDGSNNNDIIFHKGQEVEISTFSAREKIGSNGLLGYVNGTPTYVLPEYYNMENNKIYVARLYDKKADELSINDNQQTSNNKTQNENCISGDCSNGYGEYKTLNGTIYKGFFSNGNLNGYAVQTFTNGDNYSGNFVDGKKEGYGIYHWIATKTLYYGEWKNEVINGYGYVVSNNETTQAGIYENGKLVNNLLEDYKSGKITGDNCMGNCINGYGGLQYENGDTYFGFFLNGKPYKVGSTKSKNFNSSFYGQYDINGQPNGTGMYIEGNLIYIGSITDGKLTGKGVMTDKTTLKETAAEFDNGIVKKDHSLKENNSSNTTTNAAPTTNCISGNCTEGFGELKTSQSTITGFFSGGKANGYGKEVYADGSGYYQGKFESGKRGGFGMYTWNNDQSYYIGEWKDGKQHGYGYFKKGTDIFQAGYYENGKQTVNMLQSYKNKQTSGNCVGDCTNGFGYYKYSDNSVYVGFFTNNQINNIGAYTWTSGDVFIGEILNGQLSGQGIIFYKSAGTSYYGNLSNGVRQGMGVYFNKSGVIESKGFWDNGVLKTPY